MTLAPLMLLVLFAIPGSASETDERPAVLTAEEEQERTEAVTILIETIEALHTQQQALEEQIALCRDDVNKVIQEKNLLDDLLLLYSQELYCFDQLLLIYDELLVSDQNAYDQLEDEISAQHTQLTIRLRQSREEGVPGLLELFGSSADLFSFFLSVERQQQLQEYDVQLMSELESMHTERSSLWSEIDRLKNERHQIALKQVERIGVFNGKLQESGNFLRNLEGNVHRFNQFIQQSQAGVQTADIAIEQLVNGYVASLDAQKLEELENIRIEKEAQLTVTLTELMDRGILQQGAEYFLSGSRYILPLYLNSDRAPVITSVMGYCTYQIDGKVIGDYHGGIDISSSYGTSVVASAPGVVVATGFENGYGHYVVLWHETEGVQTRYAHLSGISVSPGDYLLQGEVLGEVGSSGNSKGMGCHFEMWIDGKRVNPATYLTFPIAE